jgi:N utilization substance protein B
VTTAKKTKPPTSAKPRGRPRTGSRVAAVMALYQSDYMAESAETVIDQFIRHRIGVFPGSSGFDDGRIPEADVPLFTSLVRKAAQHGETIDGIVSAHLDKDWPLTKLDPVLRALLRAACTEFWGGKEPPARVVINEYLDIAHGFFGGDEPRFANGVLDAMARTLRAEEFAAPPPRA